MRLLKILAMVLIPLVLLVGLAYLNRCRLGEALLGNAIKRADMRPLAVHINELGLTGLTINNLSISKTSSAGEMVLNIKNLTIRYTPAALIRGDIDALIVEKLVIILPYPEPPKESAPTLADIPRQIFIPPLPTCEFTVKTLIIKGRQMGPFNSRPLHFHGIINPTKGAFTLTHLSDQYGSTIISGEMEPQSGHLTLKLRRESEAIKPALQLDITLESNVLSSHCSIDLHETRAIMTPFAPIQALPELHGQLNLRLLVKREENNVFSVEIGTEAEQSGTGQLELESVVMGLTGRLRETEPGHLLFTAEPGLTFKGRNLRYKDKAIELLTARLSANLETQDGQTTLSSIGHPLITLNGLQVKELRLDELNLHPLLELSHRAGRYSLACWPPFQVELIGLSTPEITATGRIRFSSQKRFEADFTFDPQFTLSAKSSSWNLVTDDFQLNKTGLGTNTLVINHEQLDFSPTASSWHANLLAENFKLRPPGAGKLIFKEINVDLAGQKDDLTISGNLLLKNITGRLNFNLAHQLSSGTGTAGLGTVEPLTFSPLAPLSALVEGFPFPLEISQGRFGLKTNLQWSGKSPLAATTELSLNGIGGIYDEISFQGFNLTGSLNLLPSLASNMPLTLSLAEVQCGIPITDISLQARLMPRTDQPLLTVDKIRADLLGGQIYGSELRYDHSAELNTFELKVRGLDLAAVAATMNLGESIELSGKVDGTIPLELSGEGLRVHDGVFVNQKPGGVIRYFAGKQSGLGQSPLTAVAQKALEDFHYNLLKTSADYKPSGELGVAIHLEGKSPHLDTDRPVHINLNIQQNILSLLKSLRYSEAITDKLNKKIQQKYNQ